MSDEQPQVNGRADAEHSYLKVTEVATLLRVNKDSVYAMIRSGRLPVLRTGANGRVLRVDRNDLGRLKEAS